LPRQKSHQENSVMAGTVTLSSSATNRSSPSSGNFIMSTLKYIDEDDVEDAALIDSLYILAGMLDTDDAEEDAEKATGEDTSRLQKQWNAKALHRRIPSNPWVDEAPKEIAIVDENDTDNDFSHEDFVVDYDQHSHSHFGCVENGSGDEKLGLKLTEPVFQGRKLEHRTSPGALDQHISMNTSTSGGDILNHVAQVSSQSKPSDIVPVPQSAALSDRRENEYDGYQDQDLVYETLGDEEEYVVNTGYNDDDEEDEEEDDDESSERTNSSIPLQILSVQAVHDEEFSSASSLSVSSMESEDDVLSVIDIEKEKLEEELEDINDVITYR
jgi:hypothetical protein